MPDLALSLGLLAAGFACGLVNVIAGGGSFLTLPLLIFLGLPSVVANGTNRVAIVMQNAAAVWGFDRHRALDWKLGLAATLPASLGALTGAWVALGVPDEAFKKILAVLMAVITLWTLLARDRPARSVGSVGVGSVGVGSVGAGPAGGDAEGRFAARRRLVLALGFFATGVYGGFIQAGVGFLILAVTSWAGLDLVRGNAIKVLAILVSTAVSLVPFAAQGKVDWLLGLWLGVGTVLGGLAGVRLTVLKGHRWVKAFVTVAVVVVAIKLFLD